MSQTVKHRRNSSVGVVPTTAQLALGEIAINTYDGVLYFKKNVSGVESIISITGAGGTLPASQGGTGNSSYAIGDLLYASGATTLSKLADVATGNVLISGGVTTAPAWGKVGLTTHVSGTLGVGNGGTGTATAFTAGSIVFAGASGVYSQDNAQFFWDDTNNRLGIGTTTPATALHVTGTGSFGTATQLLLHNSSVTKPTLIQRNDGTTFYLLLSNDSATPSASYNTLRPFYINCATGLLNSANGQQFSGGLSTDVVVASSYVSVTTTTAAAFGLRIVADAANTYAGILFTNSGATVNWSYLRAVAAGDLRFYDNGAVECLQFYNAGIIQPWDYFHSSNLYWDGAAWRYKANGYGGMMKLSDASGLFRFYNAANNASGAGAAATLVERIRIGVNGEFVTGAANIEVNSLGSGNRYAYIDLHGDDTYTDFSLRLIRLNTGANAVSQLQHRGTGELQIRAEDAGDIVFYTSATMRAYFDQDGVFVQKGLIQGKVNTATFVSANDTGTISVRGDATYPATMTFHREGVYAINFGLDTDSKLKVGGWSMGAVAYEITNENNITNHLPSGSRVLLATYTASSSASLASTNIFSTAGYSSFEIEFVKLVPASDGVNLLMRVYSGGAYQSGANYATSGITTSYFDYGGTGSNSGGFQTYAFLSWITTTVKFGASYGGVCGSIKCYDPANDTTAYKHFHGVLTMPEYNWTGGSMPINIGFAWQGGTGAVTGFQVYFSSGNIASGSIKVYGYKT